MAATTNINTDKETNNWFKAYIALNVTNEGLTNFVVTELRNVQTAVGISCGQCSIENLMPCPTQGLCKKRKPNNCTFHTSQIPKSCQTCDLVKQNIKSRHRFNWPSWRNTKAERWAKDPWELGKCYLPPDGYSDVSSVQKSDFNGVISILLNCTHFQTCLSPACLSPPPPDKQCPLEKIRQIGRDVRHTADCKVTDADLQNYFKALTTLLADPICLLHDPAATDARRKLSDLQNDRLSLSALFELMKEANQTLTHAKEVGERLSETLTEGLNTLEAKIQAGVQCIESKIHDGEQRLENKTQAGEQRIKSETRDSIVRIQQAENEKELADYERRVADLLRRLEDHYRNTVCCVPLSVLEPSRDKHVHDIYASPKIHRLKIENNGRRTKEEQIFTYKDCFYRDSQLTRRIYLQGEPGSGKTTFVAKLSHDWCNVHAPSTDCTKEQTPFVENILQKFKFLFVISLRDSRNQTCVTQMIKTQLIDKMYADDESEDAYKLVLQILKNAMCLVIQDGLDEWPGEDAEPSMAGIPKDHCIVLTTSRPWKLADQRIRNSQIDILLDLEGLSDPRAFTERVLRCQINEPKTLKDTVKQFEIFLWSRNLKSVSASPMLHTLVLCTWIDGMAERLSGPSMCELYTILLESLCKKANNEISHFNKSQPAPVNCFSRTKYIKPNMQHINAISKAAFSVLFSNARDTSIVFNEIELSDYMSDSTQQFSFKSGLLSIKKCTQFTGNTCSFVHKSMQEFLAAYHISRYADVINDIIFGYLQRHGNSYLDISQVFVFLCGLNITAANKLSELMNVHDIAQEYIDFSQRPYQSCVVSGYREAAANKNNLVNLHLSHFSFESHNDYDTDLSHIWALNTSRARSLLVTRIFFQNQVKIRSQDKSSARCHGSGSVSIPARDDPGPSSPENQEEVSSSASVLEIDLSLCHNLEQLILGFCDVTMQAQALVGLNNLKNLEISYCQCNEIDLSSIDLSSCHNLERLIIDCGVTLQPNALVGLNNLKLLTLLNVKSAGLEIDLPLCLNLEELVLGGNLIVRPNALVGLKKLRHLALECTCVGLDLSNLDLIESMAIGCGVILLPLSTHYYKNLKQIKIMSSYDGLDFSLLENLKSIKINEKVKLLPKLFIRNKHKLSRISLYKFDFNSSDKKASETWCLLNSADPAQCADSTSVLPSMEYITFTRVTCSSTWLRSLFSSLLNFDHEVVCELRSCQITSSVESAVSGSTTDGHTIVRTDLNNKFTFQMTDDGCPGLWEAVHGLNIKSLSVGPTFSLQVIHVASLSKSLVSLTLLETLTLNLFEYIDIQLPQSLKHLTVSYNRLFLSELRDLVSKLSSLTGPVECRLEFGCPHETVTADDFDTYKNDQFPTEKYIHIKEELEALENVEVKRFRIYDRSTDTHNDIITSSWSLRGGVVDDGDHGDDIVDDKIHENLARSINNGIRSRISMRLQINCIKDLVHTQYTTVPETSVILEQTLYCRVGEHTLN